MLRADAGGVGSELSDALDWNGAAAAGGERLDKVLWLTLTKTSSQEGGVGK